MEKAFCIGLERGGTGGQRWHGPRMPRRQRGPSRWAAPLPCTAGVGILRRWSLAWGSASRLEASARSAVVGEIRCVLVGGGDEELVAAAAAEWRRAYAVGLAR
jgi:hypothetical protein